MPLAGKPPYATDLPDSYYDQPTNTQRRVRQDAPADPNKRTSAYNTYVLFFFFSFSFSFFSFSFFFFRSYKFN